jgi:hypothetical protein
MKPLLQISVCRLQKRANQRSKLNDILRHRLLCRVSARAEALTARHHTSAAETEE